MGKKVGIVIPSYNQGKFLEEAIQSVIKNRKHIDIKLIVVDGGSTDGSAAIIKKYSAEIDWWRSREDEGQANAINIGMRQCGDCDYVMWLNSDDIYETDDAVARIVAFADTAGAGFCYGKSYFINETGGKIGEYPTVPYGEDVFYRSCIISQPSVLIESKLWEKAGGLNESFHMCLDYEMWIRLAQICKPVYFEEYIGNTRMYADTKTATQEERHLMEAICIMHHYLGDVPDSWLYAWMRLRDKWGIMNIFPNRLLMGWEFRNKKKKVREIMEGINIEW